MVDWKHIALREQRVLHLNVMREYILKYQKTGDKKWYEYAQGRGRLAKSAEDNLEALKKRYEPTIN